MNVYYADDQVTVHAGDCLDVMAEIADASVDSVVTDPPYGLEFMGKDWDRPWAVSPTQSVGFAGRENLTLPSFGDNRNANCRACGGRQRGAKRCECAQAKWDRDPAADMREFQSWCTAWATECLRLLKPGGHLVSFGGSRTWHRLATAIEDAGFEIRDSIAWLYGSGFPKSMDVSKAIDKAAGAEPIPTGEVKRASIQRNGQGANWEAGAFGSHPEETKQVDITAPATDAAKQWEGWGTALKPAFEPIVVARKPLSGTVAQTVMAHGTGALNIDGCRVATGDTVQASASGGAPFGAGDYERGTGRTPSVAAGRWPTNVVIDEHVAAGIDEQSGISRDGFHVGRNRDPGIATNDIYSPRWNDTNDGGYGGAGGASRFFPTFRYEPKAPTAERPSVDGAAHPTVKPLDLMRWLVRLITPPHGLVLDPFAGSGTTAEACIHEHMRCITIEREADYLPLIVGRLNKPMAIGFDFEEPA